MPEKGSSAFSEKLQKCYRAVLTGKRMMSYSSWEGTPPNVLFWFWSYGANHFRLWSYLRGYCPAGLASCNSSRILYATLQHFYVKKNASEGLLLRLAEFAICGDKQASRFGMKEIDIVFHLRLLPLCDLMINYLSCYLGFPKTSAIIYVVFFSARFILHARRQCRRPRLRFNLEENSSPRRKARTTN